MNDGHINEAKGVNDRSLLVSNLRYARDTVGRYKPRVQLAQRPKSTTTTTSASTSTDAIEPTRESEISGGISDNNSKDLTSSSSSDISDDSEYEETDEGESSSTTKKPLPVVSKPTTSSRKPKSGDSVGKTAGKATGESVSSQYGKSIKAKQSTLKNPKIEEPDETNSADDYEDDEKIDER